MLAAFAALESSADTAYLLSRDLRIVATNAGWTTFALANGGGDVVERWTIGSPILEAIPAPLRARFRRNFETVFASGEAWTLDYECSSANEHREFHMLAECAGGPLMLVTHSLRVARPHAIERHPADDATYIAGGVMRMCMYCRRVKRNEVERWDWVPGYLDPMPSNVSHSLCPACAELHAND